jgi:preprotein translocase SecE subunit
MTAEAVFFSGSHIRKERMATKKSSKSPSLSSLKFRLPKLRRKNPKSDEQVGYFEGAWRELKQVRWPDRAASWSLTLAVIVFSLIFAGIILGLDYVFNEFFRKVLL